MTSLIRTTPVDYAPLHPILGELKGSQVALQFDSPDIEQARRAVLGVTDVSCFPRFGIKGPHAAAWLSQQGLALPPDANAWTEVAPDTLVLRLGGSEYLVEDQFNGSLCQRLAGFDQAATAGAYQVQRGDAAFILSGSKVLDLLSELCMLDLRERAMPATTVHMTQLAGISATVLRQPLNGETVFRLWCDGSYGPYLWGMLLEIAQELGGGAVGLSCHYKPL